MSELDVLGDGRLIKQIRKEGSGPLPAKGASVKVHYTCRPETCSDAVESSYEHGQPFTFTLGSHDVILGWEKTVETMKVGECASVTIHPDLAFGNAAINGGQVPAGSTLLFDLELIEICTVQDDVGSLSAEERMKAAMEAKDAGNQLFKTGDHQQAQRSYADALRLLGLEGTDQAESQAEDNDPKWSDAARHEARNALLVSCLLNSAQCALKLESSAEAIRHASAALKFDPLNSKAFYRRGLAEMMCRSFHNAKSDMLQAARLEPRNKEIRTLLQDCTRQLQGLERDGFVPQLGKVLGEQQNTSAAGDDTK